MKLGTDFPRRTGPPALGQFLADEQARAMQPHANISWTKASDVSHLFIGESFHVAQDHNDAVLRGELLDHLAQAPGLLTADGECLWIDGTFHGKQGKIAAIGHEIVEGKFLLGSEFAFTAGHQAAILGDFVEPDEKRARAIKFGEKRNRLHQDFLHGVLGVLALAANLHAEGEDGALQEFQGVFEGLRLLLFQERDGLFDLFPHAP